ncbi:MAG: PQQ-dependent sugar dehydrogenase [Balneolaceae bacterium]
MNSKKILVPLYLFLPLLFTYACGSNGDHSPETDGEGTVIQSIHHDFRVVTVAEDFQHPWSMAFLPNGDILVTERGRSGEDARTGQLRIVRNGELLPDPVPGLPEIHAGGQGGLLDVVLHPDFESNRLIYLSYSKPNDDGSENTTAVIRGRFENNELGNVEEIFEAQAWSEGQGHYGSRLAFDDEGYLFITVGDRQVNPGGGIEEQREHPAQDLTTHHGKIIRLHDDGSVPSDNPFAEQEDALPEIWSYGHRNPQGLAVHPETHDVWANEHGPQGGDELNYIRPGINYGWPVIGYGVNYGPGEPLHEVVRADGMELPILHWRPSIAPGGLMIYSGDKFPKWQGNIFSGGMSGEHRVLSRVTVDGTQLVSQELLLPGEYRIRDLRTGPDGYIYLATDHRGGDLTPIVRLEPVQ